MKRNTEFVERRTFLGVLGGLVGLVAMSSSAGLLAAVAVTPVVALSSIAATDTINVFENLPEFLSIDRLSEKSSIYATRTDGSVALLASFYDQNRIEVALAAISPYVRDAAIASEDPRFFEHGGVDLQGTVRAAVSTFAGGEIQGGSSITQQYVKNVLVQKCEIMTDATERRTCYVAATETTPDRKLKEMRLAIGLEKKYSKNDILRQYLNIAGFGGTVYGIEAAANYYFNTAAANLTLPQAASLVATINNPVKFQLDDPLSETNGAANGYQANLTRRDYILRDMLTQRKITRAEFDVAIQTPIEPVITEPSTGCQTAAGSAFFCDYVTHVLRNDPTFGADEATRLLNFRRGGYEVFTTLDLDLQNTAENTIRANVPSTYPGWDVGSVISSVQVGTGRVLAMAQNKDYSQDPAVQATGANYTGINYNTDYVDGGSSGFQPGSTYKVFTLAEWLKEGHSLNERVDSRRKSNWGTFQDSCLGPQNYDKDKWDPKNDAKESGANYSALEATIGSINTGYIGMAKKLDLCGIRKTAEAFGMHRADGDPLLQNAASVIGTNEIAPLSLAVAFAGIANNGVVCTPVVIDRIVDAAGTELPAPQSQCSQAVDPAVTAGMAYAMSRVMTSGTAQQSYQATSPRVPMIGKTGTTDGNKDTWMSGASTKVATVAAVISLTGDANQRAVFFDSGQAATARHRMWPAVMSVANAKYGGGDFAMSSPNAVIRSSTPSG
ncbi:transglycosylase domain-containing protein [Cryobacterium sp. PH31-AA6]|uniref:transglycosylase domain-containing protein n=1 Tax=Cryobacterium sp. PH31-AA6 TaxID=3046205 RepID=UPI0024BA32B6|nr:transglycosylase domain-containing protein [Cryobacterium sp. PH31-AA6]MDJ0325430.1 transglycosylase domain-containing protein [Cryobacterium sp. PH31-AA6]